MAESMGTLADKLSILSIKTLLFTGEKRQVAEVQHSDIMDEVDGYLVDFMKGKTPPIHLPVKEYGRGTDVIMVWAPKIGPSPRMPSELELEEIKKAWTHKFLRTHEHSPEKCDGCNRVEKYDHED